MTTGVRYAKNPILVPQPQSPWEAEGAFNGCPILADDACHMLYRAQSCIQNVDAIQLSISSIGHAISFDRVTFINRRPFITPEMEWERFGCEDPRVTKLGDEYYIFYTALSAWPPNPNAIKAAVAVTTDFFHIKEKSLITPFNAKAMTMFPGKIRNKIAVMVTANSDMPPSTIGIAYVSTIQELFDQSFWKQWYIHLEKQAIPLLRNTHDHVEIGAPPVYTDRGWLLIYSYIKSYLTSHKFFGIEAALLDLDNPQRILARTSEPILFPEYPYERMGNIPNIVFPSGAILHNDTLGIYYGACDTSVCLATMRLSDVWDSLHPTS